MVWTGSSAEETPTNLVDNNGNKNSVKKSQSKMDDPVSELLSMVRKQHATITRQKREKGVTEFVANNANIINATDSTPSTEPVTTDENYNSEEVLKLKRQLIAANERAAMAQLQLTQAGLAPHTMQEALGSPYPNAQHLAANISGQNQPPFPNSNNLGVNGGRTPSPYVQTGFNLQHHGIDSMPQFSRPPSTINMHAGFTPPITQGQYHDSLSLALSNMHIHHQAPVGTKLSPMAAEFGVGRGQWGIPQGTQNQMQRQTKATYTGNAEPINYRRLLERNMSCDWKYIVDKIVCNNDQQASIFLQQKLKLGTSEQKFDIVQAIIDQAYSLMVNRFGNFLVQRCFEHGSPEQIIAIAEAIQGNTLSLSMDAFGCHVVQKAFDCVPEYYKERMVHDLLCRIPETIIHRYACHVWQKLFELRWNDSPPQIMKCVNEALCGMWHEVALGETGSLVVQNIFENCVEEDKRPCINEIMNSIDVVSHGQFGNWCIQHICEHGAPGDSTRAISHVVHFAVEYSVDQFASKVVEKCLKIGGNDFLDRYLERLTEARTERPRMPLIDIASDQFGNYLIQYILGNADTSRREIVASQIRKHMVSLRGSKYGSRVAMLCSNPAVATRPGPPIGMSHGRPFNDRFVSGGEFNRGFSGRGSGSFGNGNFGPGFR